jgi:carbon storage regulator
VLVFTRRRGEAIVIGDGIEIHVLKVGRDGVRIGVVAPADVPVHRQEIHEQICAANRAAASPDVTDATRRAALEAQLIAGLK